MVVTNALWEDLSLKWNQRTWNGESHTCTLRKFKNWGTDFLKMPDLQKTKNYFLTKEHPPRLSPHPQAHELALGLCGSLSSLHSLPIDVVHPKPSDLPVACYSLHLLNSNSLLCWNKLVFANLSCLSLPLLFRLTLKSIRIEY